MCLCIYVLFYLFIGLFVDVCIYFIICVICIKHAFCVYINKHTKHQCIIGASPSPPQSESQELLLAFRALLASPVEAEGFAAVPEATETRAPEGASSLKDHVSQGSKPMVPQNGVGARPILGPIFGMVTGGTGF